MVYLLDYIVISLSFYAHVPSILELVGHLPRLCVVNPAMEDLVSISSTFYEQLLRSKINLTLFLHFWDLCE